MAIVWTVAAGGAAAHERAAATAFSFDGLRSPAMKATTAAAPETVVSKRNMEWVANVPLPTPPGKFNFGNQASDLELHGDHAFVGSYTRGLAIVNIKDPTKPFIEGVFDCSGGQNDVQLSPDGTTAILAIESSSGNKTCHPNEEGFVVIDVRDRAKPREIGFVSDVKPGGGSSGQVADGAHNTTLDYPLVYVDQYLQTYGKAEVFNIAPTVATRDSATPTPPEKIGEYVPDVPEDSAFHDSIPDHRLDGPKADGKNLLYAASITQGDVLDIQNPRKPRRIQRIADPQVGIWHGAEPNFDRSLLIASDEYGGGSGVGACGGRPGDAGPRPGPGQVTDPASLGALHFYRLGANGLVGLNGTDKAGIFNINYQANANDQLLAEAGCTAHVFWQAPDQNRLTIAWYGRGVRIVDFANPAQPKELGSIIMQGAEVWSAKPHKGFIFAGDTARGLDVFRYVPPADDQSTWPANSGPAEAVRPAIQRCGPGTGKEEFCPADATTQTPPGVTPGQPGSPQGVGQPPQAQITGNRRFLISRRALRAGRGTITIRLSCRSSAPCRGRLTVRAGRRTLGSAGFSIASRTRGVVRVRLSRSARRLVARKRRTAVTGLASVRAAGDQGAFTTSSRFQLSRAR